MWTVLAMLLLQLPIDRHPSRVNACYIRLNLLWCLEILDAMPASWFVVIKTVACSHAFICKICCESMSNMINSSYGLMLEGTGGLVPTKVCRYLNVSYSTLVGCRPYSGRHSKHSFNQDEPVTLHQDLVITLSQLFRFSSPP